MIVLNSAKNHFQLFDLPVSFALDSSLLAERYRALMRETRADDDRITADPDDSGVALALAQIEDAYRTLADSLLRADYLLGLYAVDRDHTLDAATPADNGGDVLMAQMELREILAEAANRPDSATAVAELLTQLAEEGAALDKTLQGLFADPSPRNLSMAREILRQIQFIGRCRRDVEDRRADSNDDA